MSKNDIKIVEKLPNSKFIVKIEHAGKDEQKNIKYALADEKNIINIFNQNGKLSDIKFFDTYTLNELGDIIIGIKKVEVNHYSYKEDLLYTGYKPIGYSKGLMSYDRPFFAEDYYDHMHPTKVVEETIQSYIYRFGVINRNGLLVVYPSYDDIKFGNEDTCIVGLGLNFGYKDLITGKSITPVCFKKAGCFSSGRAAVKYRDRYGFLDRNKIMTNPNNDQEYAENLSPKYYRASGFIDKVASVCLIPGNPFTSSVIAKIDLNGNIIERIYHHYKIYGKIKK